MSYRFVANAAIVLLWLATAGPAAAQARLPVILDTDIGTDIDDAWALGFAMRSPEFDLVGVTISDGDTWGRAKIACKLLHVAGRGDVPVAVGRATPPPDGVDHQFTWAEDYTATRPIDESAAAFIVAQARARPGALTLMAVGPLQNVADALRLEPELPRLLKRLVLMSGSIRMSAWTPHPVPEWNVVRAVEDARLVYAAGFPLTIVPLDATTYVTLRQEERERLRQHPAPLPRALESLYRLWLESPSTRMTLHDQLAVAETASPGTFFGRQETLRIRVDAEGYTRIDEAGGRPATVCLDPKRDAFMQYYLDGLVRPR